MNDFLLRKNVSTVVTRKKSKKYPPKKHIRNLAIIVLATCIDCAGYLIFIKPNDVLAGGLWGIAAIINHFFDAIPMGVYVAALNIPLLIWGWNRLSLRFALYTICLLDTSFILKKSNKLLTRQELRLQSQDVAKTTIAFTIR